MVPSLKKVTTGDARVDKFQDYVSQKLDKYNAPFLNGRMLTISSNGVDVNILPLTTTATNYEHKLGREPIGFLVTYQDANAVIWWDRSSSEDRSLFIRLDASASVNAKVWVF